MSEELEVLKIVAERLNSAAIPYMITGSMAMNFYAMPRMTRDIDIVVDLPQQHVERVYDLFSGDFYMDKKVISQAVAQKGMFNIIHNTSVIKVDLIIRKNSEYRKEEFRRRQRVMVEGVEMALVAPEDLILSKLFWARESRSEMQLADVRNLLGSVEDLDHRYLEHWISHLGLDELYREVVG